MPLQRLTFKPGVNRDQTNYAGEGGFWECDKIRFRSGFPEKIGGWVRYGVFTLLGICRSMYNWVTSYSDNIMAYGTNKKVYLEAGTNIFDVTPLIQTTLPGGVTFAATSGSSVITVTDPGFPSGAGDYVTFSGAVSLGGNITAAVLNQNYEIATYLGVNSYEIIAKDPVSGLPVVANASDLGNGGASVVGEYEIPIGDPGGTYGYGWGTGGFGGLTGPSIGVFTVTIASPAVVTFSTHTPADNTQVALFTTGSLPTGLSVGVAYYIVNAVGNTCNLSLVSGGTPINTSGSQSGTHTAILVTLITGWGIGGSTPINLNQREWFFDNFYNDLVFNYRKGPIYIWERIPTSNPTTSFNTRAKLLSSLVGATDVPTEVGQVLVSQQDRHLLAFGCNFTGGDFDPLLIRWANQDQPEYWAPSPTNSAGDIRVSRGSRIVTALPTRQEILVYTESHLYTLQFTGTTDVFQLQEYADNISIISSRAAITANNLTFWMGRDKFYVYSGRVDTLPTTLRNHVFNNLNYNQTAQIFSGTNEAWNEVWWFYPSAQSNQVDRYVIYNHLEKIWYYGTLTRTAWLDTPVREYPQAVEANFTNDTSIVYNHESGLNDGVLPMNSYIESNDFDIGDGDSLVLTRRVIPDVNFAGSTASNPQVQMSIRPRLFPGAPQTIDANDTQTVVQTSIDQYTNQIFIRSRGRQLAFRIESIGLNTQWQLGAVRLDGDADGRR